MCVEPLRQTTHLYTRGPSVEGDTVIFAKSYAEARREAGLPPEGTS